MATRVPQNGQQGLEKCLPEVFWRLGQLSQKKFFLSLHTFYEQSRQRRKMGKMGAVTRAKIKVFEVKLLETVSPLS